MKRYAATPVAALQGVTGKRYGLTVLVAAGLGLVLGGAAAQAPTPTPAVPSKEPVAGAAGAAASVPAVAASAPDAAASGAASSKPAATYVDRVIDGDSQGEAAPEEEPEKPYNSSGRPRQLRVELRGLRESASAGSSYSSNLISLFGAVETMNFGLLSIDANLRRENRAAEAGTFSAPGAAPESQSSLITVRQRAMPLLEGLVMNNDLGAIGFATPGLGRMSSRVFMPSHRVMGASTQWQHDNLGWQLQGSVGQPLQFDGIYASRVQRIPGKLVQVGANLDRKLDDGGAWHLGTQGLQARGVAPLGIYATALSPTAPAANPFDAQSVWLGAGIERNDWQVQAQAVESRLEGPALQASRGAWLDISGRDGPYRHSGGVYSLGRGLSWGGLPMSNGLSGLHYRGAWYSRTWLFDGGIDLLRSSTASASHGYFATAAMRRRVDSDISWGAFGSLRDFSGRGYNVAVDSTLRSDWGSSNLRAEYGKDLGNQQTWRATINQDWAAGDNGLTLSNSAGVGRNRTGGVSTPVWVMAASAFAPLSPRATFRGTANLEGVNNNQRRAVNLALNYRLTGDWMVESGYTLERGQGQTTRSLDPLAPANLVAPQTVNTQSLYLLLRYELSAGSRTAPLGGRARDGGGSVEGIVYLDQNKNGRQDAGERGAAGVTVALDGKYLTQTDSEGRFEFAWVSSGDRQVTVLNETLPLPWTAQEDGRTAIQVLLRETVRLSIGIVQP